MKRNSRNENCRAPKPEELDHVDTVLRGLRDHFKEWPTNDGNEHDLVAFAYYEGCGGSEHCGDVLAEAAPLALGRELVKKHRFRWVMLRNGEQWEYGVAHNSLQDPVNLMTLEDRTWCPIDPDDPFGEDWSPGRITNESLEHIVEHIDAVRQAQR